MDFSIKVARTTGLVIEGNFNKAASILTVKTKVNFSQIKI